MLPLQAIRGMSFMQTLLQVLFHYSGDFIGKRKRSAEIYIQVLSTRQIADILDISPNRVNNYRRNMLPESVSVMPQR